MGGFGSFCSAFGDVCSKGLNVVFGIGDKSGQHKHSLCGFSGAKFGEECKDFTSGPVLPFPFDYFGTVIRWPSSSRGVTPFNLLVHVPGNSNMFSIVLSGLQVLNQCILVSKLPM